MNRILLALWLVVGLSVGPVYAQQPVVTTPRPVTTQNGTASNTITSTNTFQLVFAAATPGKYRTDCSIQNNGTHNMSVTEGLGITNSATQFAISSGTVSTLYPGGSYNCNNGSVALQGEIDITGTSGDAFYAAQY